MSDAISDVPISLTTPPAGHSDWLADLKGRIHTAPLPRRGRMPEFVQQAAAQLPWYHQLALLGDHFRTLACQMRKLCKRFLHSHPGSTSLPSIEQIEHDLAGNDTFTEDDSQ